MSDILTQMFIPSAMLATVRDHARRAYPREACGFLLGVVSGGSAWIRKVGSAPNYAAPEKQTRMYAIDSRAWMRMEKRAATEGLVIIGIYHSHPDQRPVLSKTDFAALWPNLIYLIVSSGSQQDHPPMAWTLDENTGCATSCELSAME